MWGWKRKKSRGDNLLKGCPNVTTIEELHECIEANSYKLEEIVNLTSSGRGDPGGDFVALSPEDWSTDLTATQGGLCHTLNYSTTIGSLGKKDMVKLKFQPDCPQCIYYIWLHDPDYFVFAVDFLAVPHVKKVVDKKGLKVRVAVTEHVKLSQPDKGQKCEIDPNYSFRHCVKNSLSKQVGCRSRYDSMTDPSVPLCTALEEMEHFETLWKRLSDAERKDIESMTACFTPCNYRSYKIIDDTDKQTNTFGLILSTKELTVERESLDYSLLSLFADCAGAEGIFFGLSLYSLKETVVFILLKIKQVTIE